MSQQAVMLGSTRNHYHFMYNFNGNINNWVVVVRPCQSGRHSRSEPGSGVSAIRVNKPERMNKNRNSGSSTTRVTAQNVSRQPATETYG